PVFIAVFLSSRRRHTRFSRDWSSDVCSSDLYNTQGQVVAYGDRNHNTVWLARDEGGRLLGVVDPWTRPIPIPIKAPKVKWLTKRKRQCSNPCECPMGGGANSFPADTLVHALDEQGQPALKPIASLKLG